MLLLWMGAANLRATLRFYDAHRYTFVGSVLLVCECILLASSTAAILLALGPYAMKRRGNVDDRVWCRGNAKRLRKVAVVSLLGLAWCLGSLN
jgi:hypothetical protein